MPRVSGADAYLPVEHGLDDAHAVHGTAGRTAEHIHSMNRVCKMCISN